MDLRSGHPYWLVKNGLLANYPALVENESCDVAVVGAGVTGALLAHSLAEAGLDCVVLDARDAASGSTAASTALLQYEIDTELHELAGRVGEASAVRAYQLGLEAIDRIEALALPMPGRCEFERRESFYFASRGSHTKRLRKEFECRKQHGFDVDFLEPGSAVGRFPFAEHGGILSRGDALIDVFQFTHGLLKRAQELGARVYDRTRVVKFDRDGDGFRLHTDREAGVNARKLVMASGYESQEYLRRSGGTLHSTYAAISEPMDLPVDCLIWESERPYFYLRTTPDSRVLIGGEDTSYSGDHRSESRVARKTERLLKRFHRLFPGSTFEVAYNWAGVFGETADGLACIGEPPEWPGVAFAAGYGGNGITMSVVAAKILTDHCRGVPNPDAAIYRFDR